MPDTDNELIEKAGAMLNRQNAQDIVELYNSSAANLNKLGQILDRAGITQAAEEAPAEGEDVTEEDDAPPAEEGTEAEEKMVVRPTQKEVNYTPVSTKKGAACSNCRWFSATGMYGDGGAYCHLIDNWPDDIVSNGYCDRHEAIPTVDPTENPLPVVIVEMERQTQAEYVSKLQQLKNKLPKIHINIKPRWRNEPNAPHFTVFKDAAGVWRWVARYTNNFQDLEGEIISEKALEDYVLRTQLGFVPMPTLRVWHIPGSEHGEAEQVFGHGSFVYAIGAFDDTPEAKHAIAEYRREKGKTRLSQGFTHPKWAFKDGIYQVMNTFEISTLPPGAAANPFTSFEEIQTMQIGEQQRQYLEKTLGKEKADAILATAEKDTETIKELGVAYKDFADPNAKPTAAAPTEEQIVAKAFVEVVEAQSEILRIVQAQEATIKALNDARTADVTELKTATDTIAALRTDLDALTQKTLGAAPRRASTDPRTALTPEQAAQVEKQIPVDIDPFFGNLAVPKKEA